MTVSIETLPDHPLLEMFNFYVEDARGPAQSDMVEQVDSWHALVHVCRRWRSLVFASSCRLNLRILCTQTRRPKKVPKFWPALPIVIWCEEICYSNMDMPSKPMVGAENIVSALRHRDQVSQISLLNIPVTKLFRFIKFMHASFPILTHVELGPGDNDDRDLGSDPFLDDSFLGGSAPCLRSLRLHGIVFPALPKLLLSITDLVDLHILDLPPFDAISPGELAYYLSTLTKLEDLRLGFFFAALDDNQHGVLTRVDLPHLIRLDFNGPVAYLEDFVGRINIPLLRVFQMAFFGNRFSRDTPQLTDLVDRAERFEVLDQAELYFDSDTLEKSDNITVKLLSQKETANRTILQVQTDFDPSRGRFLALAQARSSFPSLTSVEYLSLTEDESKPLFCHVPVEDAWWLQLLRPFTAVKRLYLAGQPGLYVARALHDLSWEGVVEVLPALQRVFLEGPQPSEDVVEAIGPFIVRRQLSGHPVTVHSWEGMGPEIDVL